MADRPNVDKRWRNCAVLLAGHGSASKPDGAIPLLDHAETVRARGIFADVQAGFLRQEPDLAEMLEGLDAPEIFIVPVLASRGYVVGSVIGRKLGLEGRITQRQKDGREQTLCYCEPVGTHRDIPGLIAGQVRTIQDEHRIAPAETDVLLVGHGTHRNPNSERRTREVADALSGTGIAASVIPVFLEQGPNVDDWPAYVSAGNVVVLPFLIASGYHGSEDLPGRVGLDVVDPTVRALTLGVGAAGPYEVSGRKLWYCSPIGNDPAIADIIVSLVEEFDANYGPKP
ncbi:MAG: hypothetical protein MI741_13625 [Rhodospirillales bacterium]|nr:hypothetical protein [Rhodospirillales bacterium]